MRLSFNHAVISMNYCHATWVATFVLDKCLQHSCALDLPVIWYSLFIEIILFEILIPCTDTRLIKPLFRHYTVTLHIDIARNTIFNFRWKMLLSRSTVASNVIRSLHNITMFSLHFYNILVHYDSQCSMWHIILCVEITDSKQWDGLMPFLVGSAPRKRN